MDTRTLVELGERVGLLGEELKGWMSEEEKRQRDEKAFEREAAKEPDLLAVERERIAAEQVSSERARAEANERSLQLRIRLGELDAAREDRTQQGVPNEGIQVVRFADVEIALLHSFQYPLQLRPASPVAGPSRYMIHPTLRALIPLRGEPGSPENPGTIRPGPTQLWLASAFHHGLIPVQRASALFYPKVQHPWWSKNVQIYILI
ncbi:hypothetical protein MTO96_017883 [Rhipicephalus appendiculatus]